MEEGYYKLNDEESILYCYNNDKCDKCGADVEYWKPENYQGVACYCPNCSVKDGQIRRIGPTWIKRGTMTSDNVYMKKYRKMFIKKYCKDDPDRVVCRICGSKDNVQIHHLVSKALHPELSYILRNGVLLCNKHHQQVHEWNIRQTKIQEADLLKDVMEIKNKIGEM